MSILNIYKRFMKSRKSRKMNFFNVEFRRSSRGLLSAMQQWRVSTPNQREYYFEWLAMTLSLLMRMWRVKYAEKFGEMRRQIAIAGYIECVIKNVNRGSCGNINFIFIFQFSPTGLDCVCFYSSRWQKNFSLCLISMSRKHLTNIHKKFGAAPHEKLVSEKVK